MQSDIENKISHAENNLQRKLDWISRHDTRIGFATGVSIGMLGILATACASITNWCVLSYIIFGLSGALLFASLIVIYFSQYPKTKSKNDSLLFFGTIAILKLEEFKKRFKQMNEEEYLDDLLSQIHVNAEILNKKFLNLKASLILLLFATAPWIYAIYLSKIYLK